VKKRGGGLIQRAGQRKFWTSKEGESGGKAKNEDKSPVLFIGGKRKVVKRKGVRRKRRSASGG